MLIGNNLTSNSGKEFNLQKEYAILDNDELDNRVG